MAKKYRDLRIQPSAEVFNKAMERLAKFEELEKILITTDGRGEEAKRKALYEYGLLMQELVLNDRD